MSEATSADDNAHPPTPSTPSAPPVVAVVVTHNPGPWFEETLVALRDQDYPNLSVLVIDAGSADDPLPKIAHLLPGAYLRRLSRNPGYAAATNRAMRIVQGASHLLLCHDDVAPAPDAVRRMTEEAFRSNAGLVMPKLVEWDEPDILQSLGSTADRTGTPLPVIEAGDLDQGQHDHIGEVFAASSGCVLVRADLFNALGGFDTAMSMFGEMLDLSWRAQLVGARVVTEPAARVRHLSAAERGLRLTGPPSPGDDNETEEAVGLLEQELLERRHRLRTILKVRRGSRLLFAVPWLVLLGIAEAIYFGVTGRGERSNIILNAWAWNVGRWRELRRLRRHTRRSRSADDGEVERRLGSAKERLESLLREEWELHLERLRKERKGRELVGALRNLPLAVWATVSVVWIFGSRNIFADGLASVAQFGPLPQSPFSLLGHFSGMAPDRVWGYALPESPLNLIVGLLALVLGGAMGVTHELLVLGMLPIGVWGVSRLTRPLRSPRGRLLAILAYASVPLPYDALGTGQWDALVAYAAAPWVLNRLLRALGSAPYLARRGAMQVSLRRRKHNDDEDLEKLIVADILQNPAAAAIEGHSSARLQAAAALLDERTAAHIAITPPPVESTADRLWFLLLRRVFPLGLLLAAGGTVAPQLLTVALIAGAALALGAILGRSHEVSLFRLAFVVGGAVFLALVLLVPGIAGSDERWAALWSTVILDSVPADLVDMLHLSTGSFGLKTATLGLLIAALPGVLVGSAWRFHLSVQLWTLTFVCVILGWLSGEDALGPIHLDQKLLLTMAAAAVALNIATGAVAIGEDLKRYKFGWRQLTPVAAVVGVVVAMLPIAGRAGDGSWQLPEVSNTQLLSWMSDQAKDGSFRSLWLGDPQALPGAPRKIAADLAGTIAVDSAVPLGPGPATWGGDGQVLMSDAIQTARAGETVQLGRLLTPYSVRYLVVPKRVGASPSGDRAVPVPAAVLTALSRQLDLRLLEDDDSITVYENVEWLPIRAQLSDEMTLASHADSPQSWQSLDLSGSAPVLPVDGRNGSREGRVGPGIVFLGQSNSAEWRMRVNGKVVARASGFGWATTYEIPQGGPASLKFHAPPAFVVLQVADGLGWALVVLVAVRYRSKRRWYV